MDTRVTHTDPTLADNEKTIEFLIGRAGGDQKEIAKIREWGEKRQARIEKLCGFAGFLERDGILDINDRSMSRIALAFAFQHCIAIASRHGFDMGYTFRDSESGSLAATLTIDLYAVRPDMSMGCLFEAMGQEADFLEAVTGKDPDELGVLARELVIEEAHRMIILPQR